MMFQPRLLLLLALTLAAQGRTLQSASAPAPAPSEAPNTGNVTCPPPGFDSVLDFDFLSYISQPWYALAQIPLVYQPRSQFFCVQAVYEPMDPSNPLAGVRVINSANEGSVTGRKISTSAPGAPTLEGKIPDPSRPSKLEVGFNFPGQSQLVGTQFKPGPYWVVATGDDLQGGYEWAIISGGAPTISGVTGCRSKSQEFGVEGLWLFSRDPLSEDNYAEMMAALDDLGLDSSLLVPVEHEGCTY